MFEIRGGRLVPISNETEEPFIPKDSGLEPPRDLKDTPIELPSKDTPLLPIEDDKDVLDDYDKLIYDPRGRLEDGKSDFEYNEASDYAREEGEDFLENVEDVNDQYDRSEKWEGYDFPERPPIDLAPGLPGWLSTIIGTLLVAGLIGLAVKTLIDNGYDPGEYLIVHPPRAPYSGTDPFADENWIIDEQGNILNDPPEESENPYTGDGGDPGGGGGDIPVM
jgi:hypothetical protein